MFIKEIIMFMLAYVVHFSREVSIDDCKHMVNGCSVPSVPGIAVRIPYAKNTFKPACDRHDICYYCGPKLGWSREECDTAFKSNMEMLCSNKFPDKKTQKFVGKWLKKVGKTVGDVWHVAKDLAEWLTIPDNTLEHCKHGAHTFYEAVSRFAKSHYGTGDEDNCKLKCAKVFGDPGNLIEEEE